MTKSIDKVVRKMQADAKKGIIPKIPDFNDPDVLANFSMKFGAVLRNTNYELEVLHTKSLAHAYEGRKVKPCNYRNYPMK